MAREKRNKSRSPHYKRQEGFSESTTSRENQDNQSGSFGLRLARFINPWHVDDIASEKSKETEDNATVEAEEGVIETEVEATETVEAEQDSEKMEEVEVQENETITSVIETQSVEYLDDNTESELISQTTLVITSQDFSPAPEDSVSDIIEDHQNTKHSLDGEESNANESDSNVDRRESKRAKWMSESQSSTPARSPARSTRRTTRSLATAAKMEVDSILDEKSTSDLESNLIDSNTSQLQTQEEVMGTSKTKSSKKKGKGKKTKKIPAEEVEEGQHEIAEQEDRIAEHIRKSEDIIKESEALGVEMEDLDNDKSKHRNDTLSSMEQVIQSTTQYPFLQLDTIQDAKHGKFDENEDHNTRVEDEVTYIKLEDDEDERVGSNTVMFPLQPEEDKDSEDMALIERHEKSTSPERIESFEDDATNSRDNYTKSLSPEVIFAEPQTFSVEPEFSPMQTRSPSPREEEQIQQISEEFMDCLPIPESTVGVSPKVENEVSIAKTLDKYDLAPVHNIEILESFFKAQKGKLLTPKQAYYCCELIWDSVDMPGKMTMKETPLGQPKPPVHPSDHLNRIKTSNTVSASSQSKTYVSTTTMPVSLQAIDSPEELPPLPSLDEYLEIEKYCGVEWDELPDHVKVKRYLEWKGTEPPEVAKKRRMKERERIRKKNAEYWTLKEKADAEALSLVAAGVPSKRNPSDSDSASEDENESLKRKKTVKVATEKVPLVFIADSPPLDSAKLTKSATSSDQSLPRAQTVAEKIMEIVRKETKDTHVQEDIESTPITLSMKPISTQPTSTPIIKEAASELSVSASTSSNTAPLITPVFSFGLPKTESAPSTDKLIVSPKPLFNFGINVPPSIDSSSQSTVVDTPNVSKSNTSVSSSPVGPSSTPFGSSVTPFGSNPFKTPSTTFSVSAAPVAFGTSPSPFGSSSKPFSMPSSSPGAAPVSFGTSSPFGSSPKPFGAPAPFGATSSPFGSTSGFGGASSSSPGFTPGFGNTSSPNQNVSKATSSPWGTSSSSDKEATKSPWGTPASSGVTSTPFSSSLFPDNKSSFSPTTKSSSGGISLSAPKLAAAAATAPLFGGSKSPTSFGLLTHQKSSELSTKSPASDNSLQSGNKDQEGVIELSDGADEEGDEEEYSNNGGEDEENSDYNEGGWSGDENAFYGDSGQDDDLHYLDEDNDDDQGSNGSIEQGDEVEDNKTSIFGPSALPKSQLYFGQSTTDARRPSETGSLSTSSRQAPRTPEFDFEIRGPKLSVTRPISPTPDHKAVGSFRFDMDNDSEEEVYFDNYVEEEDGNVSPFSSPILEPRRLRD
ncbi:hypothetical protein BGZ76_001016 [Entomortierella beljakovae]|nr:hypothetical protein BGZ76_001016 [Entomortierella beljakovae]